MEGSGSWQKELRGVVKGEVLIDAQACRYTSLAVGGRIDALVFPADKADLAAAVRFLKSRSVPFLPLGNGTNVIVTDRGYRGALLGLAALRRLAIAKRGETEVVLEAQAGAPLAEVVSLCIREGLTGMEFCAGIPGSVGGAVRMNAGAYGGQIQDVLKEAEVMEASGHVTVLARDELSFSYRNLDLPAETIIIGATFSLKPREPAAVADRVREIIALRRERHPLDLPNAGSIFKNLPGIPAGRLIDEANLKGVRIGNAKVSERHANFIVNLGGATASDVLALARLVRQRVLETTGKDLEMEVRIIGEQ